MKTRSQKRKEKKEKLAKTGRVIRLKKRLTRIHKKKCAEQQDSHMTAIMEAYILKRKAERRAERERLAAEAAANADASGVITNNESTETAALSNGTTEGMSTSSRVNRNTRPNSKGNESIKRGVGDRTTYSAKQQCVAQKGSPASRPSAGKNSGRTTSTEEDRKRAKTRSLY